MYSKGKTLKATVFLERHTYGESLNVLSHTDVADGIQL